MNIFDVIKVYDKSGWEEVTSRKFTAEELAVMGKCVVVRGDYSLAVKIDLQGDKCTFIPIDKRENVKVGDILQKETLEMTHLKYTGSNPKVKVKECLVIRIAEASATVEQLFNNPFGI